MDKRELIERLLSEYEDSLRGYFYKRLRSREAVQELAQEMYVRMLSVPNVESIRTPVAYLFSVAGNLVREYAGQERRRQVAVEIDDVAAEVQLAEIPAFGAQIDAEQRKARLREVLSELRPKCQAAVILAYWHEQSYEQIALQIGVSTNMVKKYLRQALEHCRRRMARLR